MPDDLKMIWDSDLMEGDLEVDNGDFTHDGGLETAVIMSLFTDRRARDDDELLDEDLRDKRGWWGDLVSPEVEGDQIGSRLYLLSRAKTTEEALVFAKEVCEEALQWMIEDKVASSINVETERMEDKDDGWMGIKIEIRKYNEETLNLRYGVQWEEQRL
jgi:phage gp46-like protein